MGTESKRKENINLEILLRDVSIRYFYIIIGIFSLFSAVYWYYDIPLKYITTLCVIVHIFFLLITYKLDYKSIKPLIPLYLVFISLVLVPLVLIFWHLGRTTALLWYLLIPIGTRVYYPMKTVVFLGLYVFIFVCFGMIVTQYIPDKYIIVHFTETQLETINVIVVFTCLCLIYFFMYYINKISLTQMHQWRDHEVLSEDVNKYNDLYINILKYFDMKKPYCDPDFSISQLANALNSNVTYISRALNMRKNTNFNTFINTYRINMVKKMIDEGYHDKFTIRYIYTAAGFRHQSTFNKVFKQIEGINPSEYIHKKMAN